ncbi:GNAT family N-acetyltransferase [Bacillus sp. 31A1R]|uniref:GNAT family N-acetyltransferase n=1 Tax=Robertmurraya mangrovi TaxID=3098077 RepID=A0ABU5IYT9_9BACI|nr:GNAT family N-acetyltransferase [Bacillus sp. 31A1R]MDZ5472287.1 GNAT family N-acetyltransferase [Bacillus sp. 31A1R]
MNITIQQSNFNQVKPLIGPAFNDGLNISRSDGNVWFTASVDGKVVGVVSCIVREQQQKAYFKRGFVLKEFRRRRIYNQLFEARMNFIKENENIKVVSALCTTANMDVFLHHGFKVMKKHSQKYTLVELTLK